VKNNRFLRILAVAVILSLLMFAVPATPALAGETLTLYPSNGEVGDSVNVVGNGFQESIVNVYFSSQWADEGDEIDEDVTAYKKVEVEAADAEGYFNTDFDIPGELTDGDDEEDVSSGYYYIYTTYSGDDDILSVTEFTVRGVEVYPAEGPVGTEVEIDGIGFKENRGIIIEYDGADMDIVSGDEETDDYGEFGSTTFIVPESTAGDHTIRVRAYYTVEVEFTVEPTLDISQTSGVVGDEVTAIGTGFGYNKSVTITFSGIDVANDDTNEDGSFEIDFEVPEVGPGTYEVEARDHSNNQASTAFTITTNLAISPATTADSPGHVGQSITVSGAGFKPSWQITVTYASTPVVFTTTSLEDGSFSYTFEVPPSGAGAHTITATDGTSSMQVIFFMESTPPAIPLPLLPNLDEKAEPETYFDWESVTDDSEPVTYDLQVAADADFANIVVEKTELTTLTTSEYTLTEEERLESTSEEEPYYWRVRAVDAASNVGDWSDAGTFSVGSSFQMKGWLLYTLIGIGVIGVFFLGFWLGRRTIPEDYYY
jgi:hypothetical protein